MAGAYARLGFGKWGILAEHDVTDRTRNVPDSVSFRQRRHLWPGILGHA